MGPWLVKPLFPISRWFRHVPHFGSSFFIKIIFLNLESIGAKIRNFSWGKPISRDLRFFSHHLWFSCQPYLLVSCSSSCQKLKVKCRFSHLLQTFKLSQFYYCFIHNISIILRRKFCYLRRRFKWNFEFLVWSLEEVASWSGKYGSLLEKWNPIISSSANFQALPILLSYCI